MFEKLVSSTERLLQNGPVPGAAIAIVVDGKLARSAGLGVRRLGTSDPVTTRSLFDVASLTKMVTAIGVLSAVDDHLLDLHAPLTDAIPYFALDARYDPSKVTLHHLLSHTSGLPDWNGYNFPLDCSAGPANLSAYWHRTTRTVLWFQPGTLWDYTNAGYSLAGLALEDATQQIYPEAIRQRVLEPAGMTGATFDGAIASQREHAWGYYTAQGGHQLIDIDAGECGATMPAGGLFASVEDYAHLAEVLLARDERLLSTGSHDALMSPVTPSYRAGWKYAYGLEVVPLQAATLVFHTGYTPGFSSLVLLVPERAFAYVGLFNGDLDLKGMFDGPLQPLWPYLGIEEPFVTTDPGTWGRYEGHYTDANYFGALQVVRVGDHLEFTLAAGVLSFEQWSGDTFLAPLLGIKATFWPFDQGERAQTVVTRDGVFVRDPDFAP